MCFIAGAVRADRSPSDRGNPADRFPAASPQFLREGPRSALILNRSRTELYCLWLLPNNDDWHPVLDAVARGAVDLDCLVSHRVPLDKAYEALVMMRDQSEFFAKVLIQP